MYGRRRNGLGIDPATGTGTVIGSDGKEYQIGPGARLHAASLEGANLVGANLEGAYLQHANLEHANLRGANLTRANLNSSNLSAADLRDAKLYNTSFVFANLTLAKIEGLTFDGDLITDITWPEGYTLTASVNPDAGEIE